MNIKFVNVVAGTGRRYLHMEMWIRSFVGQHLFSMQGRDGLGWLNKSLPIFIGRNFSVIFLLRRYYILITFHCHDEHRRAMSIMEKAILATGLSR